MSRPAARNAPKPWREVATPRPDVLDERFSQSEFAADLTAVDLGRAVPEYRDPRAFFETTLLTQGMRKVLVTAAERLAGNGGEPVITLRTTFGGGKTHTMLALRHLAAASDPMRLAPLADILSDACAQDWKPARVFTFVGTGLGSRQRLSRDTEPPLFTPWGLMAWRLGGQAGRDLMAEAEAARSPPGSERLAALLDRVTPCLILFDELVAYARVLEGLDFEGFLGFIQSLTEAVRMTPGTLLVTSLIGSDEEAGGERGAEARRRLDRVLGRVQSAWLPIQGHERYDIVRHRLFQPLDAAGELERDATVTAFADLYRAHPDIFPDDAVEASYRDVLTRSYPIHPELLRLFDEVWSGGPTARFQQTRGVLRAMASTLRALWHAEDPAPLILPDSLPLTDPRTRSALLDTLDPRYAAVLDEEVDGDGARPRRLEAQLSGYLRVGAMTRASRAVFMATAPLADGAAGAITGPRLRLACVLPGDQLNIFGDALRELAETSAYLHRDGERTWFSTTPTLNRLASEIARDLREDAVDARLRALLQGETGGSKFARVHIANPDDPTAVDDSRKLGLVILDCRLPHAGGDTPDTPALQASANILQQRGPAPRQYRNALLFAAADSARLDDARWAVRQLMAWSGIYDKALRELNQSPAQQSEIRSRKDASFSAARRAVRAAWSHLIVPAWPDGSGAGPSIGFELHAAPIQNSSGDKSVAEAAFERAARDGAVVVEKLGGRNLAMALDGVIGDQPHITVRDLADWSARYVHMKRLHTESLLAGAIEELIGSAGSRYAWADRFDAVTGRYVGLRFGRVLFPDMRGHGLLVRRDVASAQAATDAAGGDHGAPPGFADAQQALALPNRHFRGTAALDPARPATTVTRLTRTVVAELARAPDTTMTLSLTIDAHSEAGFPDDVVSAVAAAGSQLLSSSGFN